MASKNARSASQRTVTKKRKGIPQTNPNSLANLQPFKSRAENGGEIDPRINQGGRPKLLGESYKDWLAKINENDPAQRTNAELGAMAIGLEMLKGDVSAAREIRAATEGEKLRTWEDDLADLVREGTATVDDVRAEFGNEIAARIFVRLGVLPSQSRSVQSETTRAE